MFQSRWYAVDVLSCKFAVSLPRNDVTPLQLPRVFTLFMHYASRGREATVREPRKRGRDNERAVDGCRFNHLAKHLTAVIPYVVDHIPRDCPSLRFTAERTLFYILRTFGRVTSPSYYLYC